MKPISSNGKQHSVFQNCSVNVQGEVGESWGGLERCDFNEKDLEKIIYCVTVSLYDKFDGKNYYNLDENDLLIIDSNIESVFGISLDFVGASIDPKKEDHWFIEEKDAKAVAMELKSKLEEIGWIVSLTN